MGGGKGGHGAKGGLNNPLLLLSLFGGCTEKYPNCIQPTTANADQPGLKKRICGLGDQLKNCFFKSVAPPPENCLPCCTCPDTPDFVGP